MRFCLLPVFALWAGFVCGVGRSEAAPALVLHVSPSGNDAWSGRLTAPNRAGTDGPLASLQGARDRLRGLRSTAGGWSGPVRVLIQKGRYELKEPFVLEPQDSGTAEAPIT